MANGTAITMGRTADGKPQLKVPNDPIIPFIELPSSCSRYIHSMSPNRTKLVLYRDAVESG